MHSKQLASGDATVSALVVRGLVAALEQGGVARRALLSGGPFGATLPAALTSPTSRVAQVQLCHVITRALELTSDPALGLRCSDLLDAAAFAPVSHLVSSSASLRQALHSLERYYRLWSDGDDYRVIDEGERVSLRMTVRFDGPNVQRFVAELLVASCFRLVRRFSPQRRACWLSFDYAAPPHRHEYSRVFGAEVHFEQPFTGLIFERDLLDAASPRRDREAHAALRMLAEERLAQLPNGATYAHRVREVLIAQQGPNRVHMTDVARTLGLTSRSLRRHLTAEGRPYQELAREAAVHTARQLLTQRAMSIQETAYEMGFSDLGSFYRAFKRWTGTTPRRFRALAAP